MDKLVRGLLYGGAANFYAIDGTQMSEEARRVHNASATCSAALGRSLMATAMLCAMEKDKCKVTFIVKGGGPCGNIVCVGDNTGAVKGCLGDPFVEPAPKRPGKLDVGAAVGNSGTLTVIRDLGMKEPYVGQSRLVSGEIAQDLAAYFYISQQQPSLVYLGVHLNKQKGVCAGGGLVIQPLPGCSSQTMALIESKQEEFSRFAAMLEEKPLEKCLEKLLNGMDMRILEEQRPFFQCDCSRERLEGVVISLGREEILDMIQKDGGAVLTCHFCNREYGFSALELETLLKMATTANTEDR